MLTILLPTLVFAATALLVFALGMILLRGGDQSEPTREALSLRSANPGWATSALSWGSTVENERSRRLDRDLKRAGFYRPHARAEFLAARNLLVVLGLAAVIIFYLMVEDAGRRVQSQVALVGMILVGWLFVAPRLYLTWLGNQRVARILAGLPDALDIVTMGVAAGLSFHDALQRVKTRLRDQYPELAAELDIVERQVSMGATTHAMHAFADRMDEPDVYAFTEVVTYAERTGADMGVVLRDYSDNIRTGIRHRAERQGNMMSVKLLFPIMLCLAPAAYLLLLSPAVVELRQFLIRENQPGGALDISNAQRVVRARIVDQPNGPPIVELPNAGDPDVNIARRRLNR